ncbi:MAG: hypothetical protein GC181_11615 [Bacteroidetes bacterium]|nr:hypothetical protein [Bacteroidota bacterium]
MQLRKIYFLVLFLCVSLFAFPKSKNKKEYHDYDTIMVLNDSLAMTLESPYEFVFLNAAPKNTLDSIVETILFAQKDSLSCVKLVDELGALQTPESYCLLYTACCRPYIVDDLNLYTQFVAIVTFYNGYSVLNKYYLNNKISEATDSREFAEAVMQECRKKEPSCEIMRNTLTLEEALILAMSELNVSKTDKKIKRIIRKHCKIHKHGKDTSFYHALNNILLDVQKLDNVLDTYYDYCTIKIAIYPGTTTLGVMIETEKFAVEKCYAIQMGKLRNYKLFGKPIGFIKRAGSLQKLILKSEYYAPGFIQQQRELCDKMHG